MVEKVFRFSRFDTIAAVTDKTDTQPASQPATSP